MLRSPEFEAWLAERPQVIKDMVEKYPPSCYTFDDTGQHGHLYSYSEDGTVTMHTTAMGFLPVEVFGVNPEGLTHCGCIWAGLN